MKNEERAIKIKLLEEIEADILREHGVYVKAMDALKNQQIFYRDADNLLLQAMGGCLRALISIRQLLYPLYHEIQKEESNKSPL